MPENPSEKESPGHHDIEKSPMPEPTASDSAKSIENLLKDIMEAPEPERERRITTIFRAVSLSHSGPLPLPQLLEHYNQVIPDGADRIMKMAENNQIHRHGTENKELDANIYLKKVGVWSALIITVCFIAASVKLFMLGSNAGGFTSALCTILTPLISLFLKNHLEPKIKPESEQQKSSGEGRSDKKTNSKKQTKKSKNSPR